VTDTTTIRQAVPADARALAALYRVERAFLAPFEPDRGESFFTEATQRVRLAELAERRRAGAGDAWVILDDGEPAGVISLSNVVRGPLQSANLGYWVAATANGRGLATKAVGQVIQVAFGEIGLHRLEAGTLVDNLASRRVLEKNGFEEIGIARGYLHIGGEWRDHMLFQLLAD